MMRKGPSSHATVIYVAPSSSVESDGQFMASSSSAAESKAQYLLARFLLNYNYTEEKKAKEIQNCKTVILCGNSRKFISGEFMFYGVERRPFNPNDPIAVEREFDRELDLFIQSSLFPNYSNASNRILLSAADKESPSYIKARAWLIRNIANSRGEDGVKIFQQRIWMPLDNEIPISTKEKEVSLVFYDVAKGFCLAKRISAYYGGQEAKSPTCYHFHILEQQNGASEGFHPTTFLLEIYRASSQIDMVPASLQPKDLTTLEQQQSPPFQEDVKVGFTATDLEAVVQIGLDFSPLPSQVTTQSLEQQYSCDAKYDPLSETERRDLHLFVANSLPKAASDRILRSRIQIYLDKNVGCVAEEVKNEREEKNGKEQKEPRKDYNYQTYKTLEYFYTTDLYFKLSLEARRDLNLLVALTEPRYKKLFKARIKQVYLQDKDFNEENLHLFYQEEYPHLTKKRKQDLDLLVWQIRDGFDTPQELITKLQNLAAGERLSWLGWLGAKWKAIRWGWKLLAVLFVAGGILLLAYSSSLPYGSILSIAGMALAGLVVILHLIHTLWQEPQYHQSEDDIYYDARNVHSRWYGGLTFLVVLVGLAAIGYGIAGEYFGISMPDWFSVGGLDFAQTYAFLGAAMIIAVMLFNKIFPASFWGCKEETDELGKAESLALSSAIEAKQWGNVRDFARIPLSLEQNIEEAEKKNAHTLLAGIYQSKKVALKVPNDIAGIRAGLQAVTIEDIMRLAYRTDGSIGYASYITEFYGAQVSDIYFKTRQVHMNNDSNLPEQQQSPPILSPELFTLYQRIILDDKRSPQVVASSGVGADEADAKMDMFSQRD